ncbi:MAG: hypothetical protein WCQ87_05445 [Parabacteroides sp.]
MAESNAPTTITRMFDPTVWGLRTNQLRIFLGCAIITAFYAIISKVLIHDSLFVNVVGGLIVFAAWAFFVLVGLNRIALYNFERHVLFIISRGQGEEQIRKYNKKDCNKVKNFSRIKNVFEGGYTEFWPIANKGNNWGIYLELFACKPEDLDVFFSNSEQTLTGVPANTIIKTVLKARKSTGDAGEQFKQELKKGNQIPLLRDICYEQAMLCGNTDSKTYKTHMGFIIPYTTKKDEAFRDLNNICVSVQKSLQMQGIANKRLESEYEVLDMFAEMASHNAHIERRDLH